MFYKKFAAPVGALIVLGIILCVVRLDKTGAALYKITVAGDSAGMLVSYAAERFEGFDVINPSEISFLQLADCCGTQAEFALSAGEFDMAVLCPDAASAFVENSAEFVIVGPLVRRSNVILYKDNKKLQKIGYTNGRDTQARAALHSLGNNTEVIPMMRTALPYALERDAVDGIVVDIADALKSTGGFKIKFIDYDEPTSVLVANRQIAEAKEFKDFINTLNKCVQELNNGFGETELRRYFQLSNMSEEVSGIWKESRVTFIKIPNAE